MTPEDLFNLEVLKLLVQLAYEDHEFDATERNMIQGLGRSWLVPEAELQAVLAAKAPGAAKPEVDWTLLRSRKDDVLTAARALMLTDGKVKREEVDLVKAIQNALG